MTESRVLYTLHTHTHTNVQTPPSCCKHQDRGIFFVGLLFSCKCKWAKHCTEVSRKSENLSIVRSLNSVIHVAKNCNNQLKKKNSSNSLLQNQIQACLQLFFTTFSPQLTHSSQISGQRTWHSIYWSLKESSSETAAFALFMVSCPVS